jgi:hypothetical protein
MERLRHTEEAMKQAKIKQYVLSTGLKKLWTYALIIKIDDEVFVKYGDHRGFTRDEVIKYALDESVGKCRGSLTVEKNLLGVWDMTEHAISVDPNYDPNIQDDDINCRKGYDNEIRDLMPIKKKYYINDMAGRSLELHPVPESYITSNPNWRTDIVIEWDIAHEMIKNGLYTPTLKTYTARDYLVDSFDKIINTDKHLLAAATGAGKETSTLALLIQIHKIKNFANDKVNVAVATIPSTISELLNELSSVSGINVGNYGFIDFSLIKIYLTRQWYDSYINNCNYATRQMVRAKATIIDNISDIPNYHDDGIVPVLFGSYHDIAKKSGSLLHSRYSGLSERIGTFSIGEAHQMLSNSNNIMWKQLNSAFPECFKLFVTGTPYDFIYGKTAAEHFTSAEYSLFTRNDLYKDKRINPNSDFINYPDFNFYGIDVKEITARLKTDDNWQSDNEGFTWQKLFTFSAKSNKFKYEKTILWLFTRMFGSNAFDENGDRLSIFNAPELCEKAKQHIMVALPTGSKSASAKVYISALKSLLIYHGVFQGTIFDAYEDNLGQRKNDIAESVGSTLTLTCIRDCTGANIPELGTFVFLRNLGDSIKFFEQATGRIGRVSDGKTNCGVFIGDLEASMAIMVNIEEKLAIDRDKDASTRHIIDEIIANYNYFTARNGEWTAIDIPNFAEIIEQCSAKGAYGVNQCIKITDAPVDFEYKFHNAVSAEGQVEQLVDNGNPDAKNKQRETACIQQGIPFDSPNDRKLNWNNMKLKFVAKCRLFAFIHNTQTVKECVDLVEEALQSNNHQILKFVGKGVEYFPIVMSDNSEIDIAYTNRWIQKLNDSKHDSEKLLELFEDPIHRSEISFIAESNDLIREVITNTLSKLIANGLSLNELSFYDPCAGRGGFLLELFKIAKEFGQDIDPTKVFYNDIDGEWHEFFCVMNQKLSLNIPEKNITNYDFLNAPTIEQVNVILTNPPFNADDTSRDGYKHRGQGDNLAKKCTQLALTIADTFVVSIMPYGGKTYSSKSKKEYIEKGLYEIDSCKEYFTNISSNPCAFYFDRSTTVSDVNDKFYNHSYEVPANNIGSIMRVQPGSLDRNQFESELLDNGKYKMVVTTGKIRYTNDEDLINRINDDTSNFWRVVFNSTESTGKLGKLIIAEPGTHLSGSVNCLKLDSEENALVMKNYLESDEIIKLVANVKTVNASNSKKYLQYIPMPVLKIA